MNLKKAIEINRLIKQDEIPVGELDRLLALNLGIEALEGIKKYRRRPNYQFIKLLPGETK